MLGMIVGEERTKSRCPSYIKVILHLVSEILDEDGEYPYEYSNPSHSSSVNNSQNLEYPTATVYFVTETDNQMQVHM